MQEVGTVLLTFRQLVVAIIVLVMILIITGINMYLLAKGRRSILTGAFHGTSLCMIVAALTYLLGSVTWILPLSSFYHRMTVVFAILSVVGVLVVALVYFFFHHRYDSSNLRRNMEEAVTYLHPMVFIEEPNGLLHPVRKAPERAELLEELGDECTLDDLSQWASEPSRKQDYHLRLSAIRVAGELVGSAVIVEDIRDIHEMETQLHANYTELEEINRKLRQSIAVAGELEEERERLRLYEQIQSVLIQEMEEVLVLVHEISNALREQKEQTVQVKYTASMQEVAVRVRGIYGKVRAVVNKMTQ